MQITIHEEDDFKKNIISMYLQKEKHGNIEGWTVQLSNGEDPGLSKKPQSFEKCVDDIAHAWGNWKTFKITQD